MTDFFSELEGHLHAAATRRARRRWMPSTGPRIVFAVAAAAATVAFVFAGLSAIDAGRDPEVAAPPPGGEVSCSAAAPPERLLARFAVLRDRGEGIPAEVAERLSGDLPGGRLAKVWPEHGRLARKAGDGDIYLVPALAGTCEEPEPVICDVYDDGKLLLPGCTPLDRLGKGRIIVSGAYQGGEGWFTAAVVPDGSDPMLDVDGFTVTGVVEGNVFLATYPADDRRHEKAQLVFEEGLGSGCNQRPRLNDAPPPPALLDRLSMFRDVPPADRPAKEQWPKALLGREVDEIHHVAGRELPERDGAAYSAVPFSAITDCDLPEMPAGAAPESAPGACVIVARPATEYGSACFGLDEIIRGQALAYDYLGEGRVLAYAIVPDGTRSATLDGRAMQIDANMAYLERKPLAPDEKPRLQLTR